jgi:hypothetical protein
LLRRPGKRQTLGQGDGAASHLGEPHMAEYLRDHNVHSGVSRVLVAGVAGRRDLLLSQQKEAELQPTHAED